MREIVPGRVQPALPLEQLIRTDRLSGETLDMDVLFVGAGPAGLAGAIELANLVRKDNEAGGGLGELAIGVLEKGEGLGDHSLSGAVVNPAPLRELFPGLADSEFPFRSPVTRERVLLLMAKGGYVPLPTPPTMRNHGYFIASLCEVVRWLGARAEALGVNIFTGFPAASLLVEGERVCGVRTVPSGLGRDGSPTPGSQPANDILAKATVLCEGSRGPLAQAWYQWRSVRSANPQLFALGVKEIWETKTPLSGIVHTMGWPLPNDAFGGSFMYALEPNLVALGLVVGLDYRDASLDVHRLLQTMKTHPFFRRYLDGGEMVEWGAKTIPEGGYYALPERRSGHGILIAGDAAGFVDVPSLKGVHYAIQSGIYAARALFAALKAGEATAERLAAYDRMVDGSTIVSDLYRTRNMRLAFKDGFYVGGAKAALMTLTGGRFPGARIPMHADGDVPKEFRNGGVDPGVNPGVNAGPGPSAFAPDGKLTFSKVDAVFRSGNRTRDTIPSHLAPPAEAGPELAALYASLCPAGVYEVADGGLKINPPNCVDCKATDVLGPRWSPREGGSGPHYKRM